MQPLDKASGTTEAQAIGEGKKLVGGKQANRYNCRGKNRHADVQCA